MDKSNNSFVTAIVLAAGSGSRMGTSETKQRISIGGQSILKRTVGIIANCRKINSIVVVCRDDETQWANEELRDFGSKLYAIVPGGKCRAESAAKGFFAIPNRSEYVLIHDGARCLVTDEIIELVVDGAIKHGAASAASLVTDTLKRSDEEYCVLETISRNNLFSVQTPQVFSVDKYQKALETIELDEHITDDNMLMEQIGEPVFLVETGRENIKITRKEDLDFAECIIERRVSKVDIRVGHGYDVHRLCEGRKLILGGVEIPFEKGLLGHSDADVLVHAVMDAILGACGKGDIGRHFPDTDKAYKNISSLMLLARVMEIIGEDGYSVSNLDATIVLQRPKVASYINDMVNNMSKILGIDHGRINVKATTEERLGFTGNEEGVCAHAVAIVKKG